VKPTPREWGPSGGGGIPEEMLAFLKAHLGDQRPAGAVVLGSGLGPLLDHWNPEPIVDTAQIPGYPRSGVPGHAGKVAVASWGGTCGLVFQGRVHFYEGYSRSQVTLAVRLAAALGARWVLLTNASGSVDPLVAPGTIVVVDDHFRLFIGGRASRGAAPGTRLTGSPYHPGRSEEAFAMLGREGLRVQRGILFGGLGPSYETAAEVEMIRRAGATVACMSTVIEAEEAARAGLEVVGISMVTNLATGLAQGRLDHEEVIAAARQIAPAFARAIDRLVRGWAGDQRPG